MRGICVATERRANAVKLVGGNSSADTTTADQYPDLGGAVLHGFCDLFCVVRIVVRNRAVVRAEVDQIVTGVAQLFDHPLVQGITAMICSDCYAHKNLRQDSHDFSGFTREILSKIL